MYEILQLKHVCIKRDVTTLETIVICWIYFGEYIVKANVAICTHVWVS